MKKTTLFLLFISFLGNHTFSQTADEIISTYYENTGGLENWKKLEGITMFASVNQMGMEIPIEMIKLKNGNQLTKITFQGKEINQNVYDGKVLWGNNFMTQEAEKADQESTDNMKQEALDFPDAFMNYKENGYTLEKMEDEDFDGTSCFKLKLTKKPMMVDGKEEQNIVFYYFDKDSFVLIGEQKEVKSGQMKGQMREMKFSDYQEVEGLYFPFSMSQGLKGGEGQAFVLTKMELNPKVDSSIFTFPKK